VIDPARSFDRAADAYERTRPDYPDALLELVPVPADATVLDLGAGTGKLTRVLARRYRQVIAVEPLDGMRAILEAVVPGVESRAGSAEAIPLADASVDAVFAAQAFHWFANDEAVAELARVLRPGGVLALVWNDRDEGRPDPLPADYRAYLAELREIAEFDRRPAWQDVLRAAPFGELERASVPHDHVLDRDGLLDNARSVSWIARRDESEQSSILARLGELLPEGTYAIPNRANVLWTCRV